MKNLAYAIRNQWKKEAERKEKRFNKAILKSKKRNNLLSWIEYKYILVIINLRAKLHLNGYIHYSKKYRFSEKTVNMLKGHNFTVYNDDYLVARYPFKMTIYW